MNRRSGFYIGIPVLAIVAFVILFVTSPNPEIQPSPIPDVKFTGMGMETSKVIGGDIVSMPIGIKNNDKETFRDVKIVSVIEQNEIIDYVTVPEFIKLGKIVPNQQVDTSLQIETDVVDTTKTLDLELQILVDEVISDQKQVLVTITPKEVP